MIHNHRMTATLDGEFVVFLIGMRINRLWQVHKWLPLGRSMGRMLTELYANPALGLLHHEIGLGRTVIMVQYWRSMAQLLDYAKNRDAAHLPAWRDFNRRIGTGGSVGIWHETYAVRPGSYETIYTNMPPFGLGKAGTLARIGQHTDSSRQRLDNVTSAAPPPVADGR